MAPHRALPEPGGSATRSFRLPSAVLVTALTAGVALLGTLLAVLPLDVPSLGGLRRDGGDPAALTGDIEFSAPSGTFVGPVVVTLKAN